MDATTYLKKAGLKLTPVRLRMVEIFDAANHALHQQEIESGFDGIDRITLYRTSSHLKKKALSTRLLTWMAIAIRHV
ncbi:MAG: hypothetical protein IPH36_13115 [Saprospiraceae bacterium]|nr:hypothetical protein [Saprospiraceae bacterium]